MTATLTLDEFQDTCVTFALYPGQGTFVGLTYATIGLNGEAGETGEQVKKTWRDDAADIQGRVEEIFRGLESCNDAHGLRQDHFESARQQITEAFKLPLTDERKQKIIKELGDTLWYAAQIATEIGVTLGEVAQINMDKLAARRAANLIHGEGSDR
jgi:NTP pyrophosphatase (non-canonical NTP hydrolase)